MKNQKNDIWIYNNGLYEKEMVPAEKWMRLIYENPVLGAPLLYLFKRKIFSHLYGFYCRTKFSARQIPAFVEKYQIDMSGCSGSYKTYADFFSREKSNLSFPKEQDVLGSPCEGMVSVYTNINQGDLVIAKGSPFSLAELFGDKTLAETYNGGIMYSIRLTPSNYHRAHFFDEGKVTESKFINGDLFSVSPLALSRVAKLYCRNKRALIQFSSQNFGRVAIVEVGATFVGSIVHSFEDGKPVKRGQEASYFLPGGSLLLMFFTKDSIIADEPLIDQTKAGYETKVNVGTILGKAVR